VRASVLCDSPSPDGNIASAGAQASDDVGNLAPDPEKKPGMVQQHDGWAAACEGDGRHRVEGMHMQNY
jgi:hypothetical protein